jgi:hypothetical protein
VSGDGHQGIGISGFGRLAFGLLISAVGQTRPQVM